MPNNEGEKNIRTGSLSIGEFLTLDVPESLYLGKDYKNISFVIADYQRTYDWEEELVMDLLTDIQESSNDEVQAYFLGAIILSKGETKEEKKYLSVVDGQQRMVTLSLLIAAIRRMIMESGLKNEETWGDTYVKLGQYIFKNGRISSKKKVPRLELSPEYRKAYEEIIVNNESLKRGQSSAIKRLDSNYKTIKKFLEDYSNGIINSEEKQKKLDEFIVYLLERVVIVVMITDEEKLDAYEIFEVLNDRRQALTQVDLLKTYFLRVTKQEEYFERVQECWKQLKNFFISEGDEEGTIKDKESSEEDLKHCIESYFMFKFGYFQPKKLYREVRNKVREKQQEGGRGASKTVRNYIEELSDNPGGVAYYYGQIKRNTIDLKDKNSNKLVEKYIAFLSNFGVLYPGLLVPLVKGGWGAKDIVRYYELLYYAILRIYSTRNSFPANKLQPSLAKMAYDFYRPREFTDFESLKGKLIEKLSQDYPVVTGKDTFINGFYELTVKTHKKARQILLAISHFYSDATETKIDMDSVHCEHILPKAAKSKDWGNFSEDEKKLYLNRLGNYTLLGGKKNQELQNKPYGEKRKVYKKSQIEMTREMAKKYTKWNKDNIQERQEEMAKLAEKNWRLDKV